nr:uncharacterized protein LOC103345689 [Oryctolagus cuniculus]
MDSCEDRRHLPQCQQSGDAPAYPTILCVGARRSAPARWWLRVPGQRKFAQCSEPGLLLHTCLRRSFAVHLPFQAVCERNTRPAPLLLLPLLSLGPRPPPRAGDFACPSRSALLHLRVLERAAGLPANSPGKCGDQGGAWTRVRGRLAARGPGSGCAAQRAGAPIRAVAAPTAAFQPPGAPRAPCAASLQLSVMHFVLGEPGRREDGGGRQRDSPRPYFHRAPVPLWLRGENALWPGFLVNPAAVPAAERGWWPPARSPGRRADGSASLPPLRTRTARKPPQCHSPLVVLQPLQLECVSHGSARVLLLCEELPRDSRRPTC